MRSSIVQFSPVFKGVIDETKIFGARADLETYIRDQTTSGNGTQNDWTMVRRTVTYSDWVPTISAAGGLKNAARMLDDMANEADTISRPYETGYQQGIRDSATAVRSLLPSP